MSFHADRESGCGGKCSAIRIAHGVITALMAPGAKSTERLLKKSLKLHASCLPRNVDRKAVSTLVLLVSQSRARLQHYLRTAGLGAGAEQARFLLAALCNSGVGGRAIGEVVSLDRLVEAGLFTTTVIRVLPPAFCSPIFMKPAFKEPHFRSLVFYQDTNVLPL